MTAEEYRAIAAASTVSSTTRRRQQESTLQSRCVKLFRARYPILGDYMTHIPNEEPDRTRRKIGAAMGVVAGYPDLMLFIPARYGSEAADGHGVENAKDGEVFRDVHGLAIELKNGKRGRHGIHQRICQMRMEACGYRYVLIRTLEEFDTEVTDYLKHMPKGLPDKIGKIAAEADKMRLEDWKKQEAKSVAKARKEFQELIDAQKRK